MCNGVSSSLVIFLLNIGIIYSQTFRDNGQTTDVDAVGTTMFTCIIWRSIGLWLNGDIVFTVATVLTYVAQVSFQRFLNPVDHHIIQEIKYYKRDVEDARYCMCKSDNIIDNRMLYFGLE
ncbi:unnamed protein product [Cochlearia groenlandica]